jgi:hypothetical protein
MLGLGGVAMGAHDKVYGIASQVIAIGIAVKALELVAAGRLALPAVGRVGQVLH